MNSSWDVRLPVTFNPANQAATETTINTTYAWDAHPTSTTQVDYEANGLNQITQADASSFTYDANGNLTSDGQTSYVYDTANRLVATSGAFTSQLQYDPLGRLYEVGDGSGGIRRLLYDGDALVAEYNGAGAMLDRYVHGASAGDDPLIRYPGAATAYTAAEHLYADRRGSIYASFDRAGAAKAINSYDEYGVSGPSSGIYNTGRFGYTGQAWVPEAGLYYYKARMYSPTLGRFMQTDPIGYGDGMNMYAYVANDPVNAVDPTGLDCTVYSHGDEYVIKADGGCPDGGSVVIIVQAGEPLRGPGWVGSGTSRRGGPLSERNAVAKPQKEDSCDIARRLSDPNAKIQLYGVSAGGLGLGFAIGNWKDLSTGYTGSFKTFMGGLGTPGGLAANGEIFRGSLTAFSTGYADTLSFGINTPIGDVGYTSTSTSSGEQSRGFTLNLNKNPFKARGFWPEAFAGHTETRIFNCQAPSE